VSSWKGITRVQSWPRKRGPAKTPDQIARQGIFAVYQAIIKRLSHHETIYERQALINHNRTHRGQRGSAAIRFRDWQTQRYYGRGVAIVADNGITFYPWAVSRDASYVLDHVTADHGQVLQRAAQQWQDIPHGQPNDVLTAGAPGSANSWNATGL